MKAVVRTIVVILFCAVVSPAAARPASKKPRARPVSASLAPAKNQVKVVSYGAHDVARVDTKLRYTSIIILPQEEKILDYVCGDAGLWVISGEANFAYVKPTQEGTSTSLSLVTESGAVYTFLLSEVSDRQGAEADLKVFVELKDPSVRETLGSTRRLVSAQELETARQETEAARAEAERMKVVAKEAAQVGVQAFLKNVSYPYRFEAGKKPFNVRAMYHTEHFTYIHARPEETPTLYEVLDGAPSLVAFSYENGMYVVQKVLGSGYFALGKKRLHFKREE